MPELPEVETIRRGLAPVLEGRIIERAAVRRHDLRVPVPADLARRVKGQRVERLIRRGKYILGELSGGQALVMHMGMSGRMKIIAPGASSEMEKHDHIILYISNGFRIVMNDPRRFGMFYLAPENWGNVAPFVAMGPEPLSNDFNGPVLEEKLKRLTCTIKAALLDQRVVAGVGNIYACEALYEAGISPLRRAGTVKGARAESLARAVKAVLCRAIAAGGSSLKDYRQADGSLGYFQTLFSVYDRAGEPCPGCDCKKGVRKIAQAGRSSFYCAARQK